jgi:hypothetical protein
VECSLKASEEQSVWRKNVNDVNQTADAAEAAEAAYFTEGELLPWKNRWFRVKLCEFDGQKQICLVMVKPTAASVKRSQRAEHWNEQHSKQPGVQRELRYLSKLRHGGGASFGRAGSPRVAV